MPAWDTVRRAIVEHSSLDAKVLEVCLPVRGEAGVGKSRLAYEVLRAIPASALVVYTNDEEAAVGLAYQFAVERLPAILIADECSVEARLRLNETLRGTTDRVRVICIDNAPERLRSGAPELWMEQMPRDAVDAVLQANYPEVPLERRRAYAEMSGGFIRFAADLCRQDFRLAAGDLTPALGSIEEYVFRSPRFREADRTALKALCLLPRTGVTGDVSAELSRLCDATGLARRDIEDAAERLKDSPGFISRAGRYFYVTPAIVARVGFVAGCERWVTPDLARFVSALGPGLLPGFLSRIAAYGTEEIRRVSADFFRQALSAIQLADLPDESTARFVETLVEARPSENLPWLRRLLEMATPDEIALLGGNRPSVPRAPARRIIVWLAERLLAFPEHFADAEAIFFVLSAVETEDFGNNATAIWSQAFRIQLSGSSIPFDERLQLLKRRALEAPRQGKLVVQALLGVFVPFQSRMLGPALVGGRVPPGDWRPANVAENARCFRAAFDLLVFLLRSGPPETKRALRQAVIQNLRILARHDFLAELPQVLAAATLDRTEREQVAKTLEDMLTRPHGRAASWLSDEARQTIEEWLSTLRPRDFHSSLVATLSRPPWHPFVRTREGEISPAVREIARSLQNGDRLREELGWLLSTEAESAPILGEALGEIDEQARLLEALATSAPEGVNLGLLKGYLVALLRHHGDKQADNVGLVLDALAKTRPRETLELLPLLGEPVQALARALSLVDRDQVDAEGLASFAFSLWLTPAQTSQVLTRLTSGTNIDRLKAVDAGLHMLMALKEKGVPLSETPEILDPAWTLIERLASRWEDRLSWEWQQIVLAVAPSDPARATSAAALALINSKGFDPHPAETLVLLAKDHPVEVLTAFGDVLLRHEKSWQLQVDVHKEIIAALPEEVVIAWLGREGVAGARRLARHLPIPTLDQAGKPVVPDLTAYVLRQFADDEQTFAAFCAGTHGFEVDWGSGVERAQAHADLARQFLNHPLPKVREWAEREIRLQEALAKRWSQEDAEARTFD